MNDKRALVLIPCCKEKTANPSRVAFIQALQDIGNIRAKILRLVQQTPQITNRPENQRGILDPNAPITLAADLYTGNLYQALGPVLRNAIVGGYPQVDILIVSALYGLIQLGEGIKEYELRMDDRLIDGTPVWRFWKREGLWRLLQAYVSERNISYVWSLLPDSLPSYPYHQVFEDFWMLAKRQKTVVTLHVKVSRGDGRSAGTGSGAKRGKWLRYILSINPHHLLGEPLPPAQLPTIPGYVFKYEPC